MSSVGIGLMYVVTALVPVPLYVRIFWVLFKNSTFNKIDCYRILAQIAVMDLLFIIGEGVVGISVVNQHKLFGLTEYVAIPILASTWLGSLAFNLLLAINRLHTICGFHLSRSLKHFLSACSYVYWLFFLVAYASRLSPMPFVDEYTFAYDTDVPFARLVQAMEFYSSCVILGLTFIIYVKVITFILLQKLRFALTENIRHEVKLLAQSFIIFLSASILEFIWNYGIYLLPDSVWTGAIVNNFIIFHAAWLQPLLLIAINR